LGWGCRAAVEEEVKTKRRMLFVRMADIRML